MDEKAIIDICNEIKGKEDEERRKEANEKSEKDQILLEIANRKGNLIVEVRKEIKNGRSSFRRGGKKSLIRNLF